MTDRASVPQVRLVADDLTGALDAAVSFVGRGEARVSWGASPGADALCHCADVRDGPEPAAARAAAETASWLLSAAHAFRKCDSRLRGHVAAELAAIDAASAPARIVIAPAFPAQGRVTRSGRVLTRGPEGWTTEPCALPAELAARGLAPAQRRPGDAAPPGLSVWDAETDADLDAVAAAGLAAGSRDGGRTLWVGSAGLAGALARSLGVPAPRRPALGGPALMLVGTDHPATRAQAARLRALRPEAIAEVALEGRGAARIAARLAQGASALAVAAPEAAGDAARIRRDVAAALARVADAATRPGTLFACGGATLLDLATHLGARGIALDGVVAPGAPAALLVAGKWDGLRLVSKSGGFGGPDFFLELLRACGDAGV